MNSPPRSARSSVSPVRLAVFIDVLAPGGGTENQLLLLLSAFDRNRVEPTLFTLRNQAPLHHAGAPFRTVCLGVTRLASPRSLATMVRAARLVSHQSDVVLTFFRDGNFFGTLAGRLAGVPVVSSRRNLGRGYWHDPAELWRLRRLNSLTSAFLANSEAVRQYTAESEHVPLHKIAVIRNALDTTRFHPPTNAERTAARARWAVPDGEKVIVCVANLRPVKDHRTLLQTFARIQRPGARAHLLLAGSGPEEPALRSLCAELGIAEHVQFLGSLADTVPVLHAADAAVLSSVAESLPNAVMEALACGVPVAATDVGGVAELLAGQPFGRLAPPSSADALAAAMAEILAGPAEAPAVRAAARSFAEEKFSLPKILDQWYPFLERCRDEARR